MTNKYPKHFTLHLCVFEKHAVVFDAFLTYFLEHTQQLPQSEREVTTFVRNNWLNSIYNRMDKKKVNELSQENSYQFVFSIFKKIREQGLASQQNQYLKDKIQQIITICEDDACSAEVRNILTKLSLGIFYRDIKNEIQQIIIAKCKDDARSAEANNELKELFRDVPYQEIQDEIDQIIIKCQDDARSAEARDLLIKFFPGLPLKTVGIKIDPKNVFGSIKSELFKKLLGRSNSEERNKQLMNEEKIVIKSLLKLFISIILLILVISNVNPITMFGITIHQNLIVGISVICFVVTGCQIIKGFFSNNQEDSMYHPSSRQDCPPFKTRSFHFSANTETSKMIRSTTCEEFVFYDFPKNEEMKVIAKRFEDDYKKLLSDKDNNVTSVTNQDDVSNTQETSTTVSNPEVCNIANLVDKVNNSRRELG